MSLKKANKFATKQFVLIGLLALIALAPLILRKGPAVDPLKADRRLNIITSHNETIRREYAEAFTAWWKEKHGETVYINWITPGGGGEVRKVIDTKFKMADDRGDSDTGMDIFFGGGEYECSKLNKAGRLTELRVFETHKELFEPVDGKEPIIPQKRKGESYYGEDKKWIGVCLSRFGICYNVDVLKRLGIDPPKTWDDLADPKYFKNIALADPTKSGSVAKAFEMIMQQKIQARQATVKRQTAETVQQMKGRALREGWHDGLKLIQRICANARYFSDSASKIPHDVAQGDSAAGMCIDFYGRTYNEKLRKKDGSSRLQWISPLNGTSTSVDTIAVFKGAPEMDLAQGFVEFLFTKKGQMLWNAKAGTKLGPKHNSLRRLPIRSDLYKEPYLSDFSDPQDNPFTATDDLTYKSHITGPVFNALRLIIRVMAIDPHDEMQIAWKTLAETNFPAEVTEDHFHDLAMVSYEKALQDISKQIKTNQNKKIHLEQLNKRLASMFRRNYKRTTNLAIQSKAEAKQPQKK